MKISYLFLIFNNSTYYNATTQPLVEVKIEEYEDNKNAKAVNLTYKSLNILFLISAIVLSILYFCNQLIIDTLDIIDSIYFTTVLLLNVVINWMTKQRSPERKEYSKKRIVCLLINFIYLICMLVAYTLGYVIDKISDCSLFTGAKNCHSDYTLFQYISTFLMLLILLLKTFF